MTHLTLATDQADADAAERVEQHHAVMSGQLEALALELLAGVPDGAAAAARDRLVRWCHDDLVPHATAEERTLYAAAAELPELRLLVEAMLGEHRTLVGLVRELERETDLVRAAATGWAIRQLFAVHLAKENEQVLPALVASPTHSVADLLAGMHDLLGPDHHDETARSATGHDCGCGEVDPAGYPELDARAVPHAIRHSTIFGALDAVRPGGGLVLVAPHDPLPMLAQLEQRSPGAFEVSYLERGPETWRLQLVRG